MTRALVILALLVPLSGCVTTATAVLAVAGAAVAAAPEMACNVAKSRAALGLADTPSKDLCPENEGQ